MSDKKTEADKTIVQPIVTVEKPKVTVQVTKGFNDGNTKVFPNKQLPPPIVKLKK